MYIRRRRKCCCMNNHEDNNINKYEDICDNIQNCPCGNNEYNNNCSCGFDEEEEDDVFPNNPMYGQSYVPIQTMDKTFVPSVGLRKGTIFPELVSVYYPNQSVDEINYIASTNKIGEGCNR